MRNTGDNIAGLASAFAFVIIFMFLRVHCGLG